MKKIGSFFLLALFGGCSLLYAAPPPEFQEIRALLVQIDRGFHGQKLDLELLQERVDTLEKDLSQNQEQSKRGGIALNELDQKRYSSVEQRVTALETDVRTLSQQQQKLSTQLDQCHSSLDTLKKQLSSDIGSLKESISSMISLLNPASAAASHTVQPGDSLSKIALKYHLTSQVLRDANNLPSDKIVIGQKLKIPPKA